MVKYLQAKRQVQFLIMVAFFIALPFIVPKANAADILAFSVVCIGYDILLGHTGIMSFGHAAYFGLGAYGYAIFLKFVSVEPTMRWIAILAGVGLAVGATWLGAFLSLRRVGIYSTFITIAFNFVVWWICNEWTYVTGGENSISDIAPLTFNILGMPTIVINTPLPSYFFNLILAIPILLVMYRILHSPFGLIIRSIRENDERVLFLGYDVHRYQFWSFMLSGLFAGIGGVLYVMFYRMVSLFVVDTFTMSGDITIMTVVGGSGSYFGPILGATIYMLLKDYISVYTLIWRMFVGILVILIILRARQGVWGVANKILLYRRR